jgi:hypothetical protein
MAESCGPYRAALSYNSKSGMARSFMFLGTARTSVRELVSFDRLERNVVMEKNMKEYALFSGI